MVSVLCVCEAVLTIATDVSLWIHRRYSAVADNGPTETKDFLCNYGVKLSQRFMVAIIGN